MSIKIKILKENEEKIAATAGVPDGGELATDKENLRESIMDMLSDPGVLASGAGVVAMIYYMLFNKNPENEDEALNRVRDEINKRWIAANINMPPDDPTDDASELDASPEARLDRYKVKRMKMKRAAAENQLSLVPEEY